MSGKVNIILASEKNLVEFSIQSLEKDGVVILRGLFEDKLFDQLNANWKVYFNKPSISGVVGYYRNSHPKAVVPAFLLGKPSLRIALEKKIISIIEGYMKSECTLAEANAVWHKSTSYVYFPLHSDFSLGWKKTKKMDFEVSISDLTVPLGVGAMYYMHDTREGSFKYSLGSHKLESSYGQHFKDYPLKLKKIILKNIVKCMGKKGDLILFDDRGFHGPDQPSKKDRSVLLLDYYRDKTFGSVVVTPHLTNITDLNILDSKQLKVLGLNSSFLVDPQDYDKTRFKNNYFYNLLSILVDKSYMFRHLKNILKNIITN